MERAARRCFTAGWARWPPLVGGWWPARATAQMAPALALKGLGAPAPKGTRRHTLALGLMALAAALAWAPPVGGIPLAAYLSVGLLLVGGIAALPLAVGWLLNGLAPLVARRALPCWRWSARAGCAKPPRWPPAAWSPAWPCRSRSP